MKKLAGSFSRLNSCKILVIGDFMLDSYTMGRVRRISPEAPVPVVQVRHEEHRPGGAGNVVLNLVSLGMQVTAVGRIGDDFPGDLLRRNLISEGVNVDGILIQKNFRTPVKNRIIADNQQIVRIDHEEIISLPEMLEQQFINTLPTLLEGISLIAISDYGKGYLSTSLLSSLIDLAKEFAIPVIADPKGHHFTKYSGVTILKPNLSEAIAAAGLATDSPLEQVAEKILHISQAEILMVTRSEEGLSVFHRDGRNDHFPVHIREVKDVTGAGDTVLAMLACATANGLPIEEAAQLSNIAAGIAVERLGCARITLSELAYELLKYDVWNKVFDEEHLFALREALRNQRCILLELDGLEGMTSLVFRTIQMLAKDKDHSLIVYVRNTQGSEDFINLLSSLREVDFIVLESMNLDDLYIELQPDEIYKIANGSCNKINSRINK